MRRRGTNDNRDSVGPPGLRHWVGGLAVALLSGCYVGSDVSADGTDGAGSDTGLDTAQTGEASGGPVIPEGAADEVAVSGLRRLSIAEYERTVEDLTGLSPEAVGEILPIDTLTPFDNDYTTQTASEPLVKGLELLAGDVSDAVIASASLREALVPCEPTGSDDAACFDAFLAEFGRRALRRPLSGEERVRFGGLLEHAAEGSDFWVAVGAALRLFLQHPEFVYRVELGEPLEGQPGVFRLGPYEIATRLSYFLTGTTPAPWLLDAADTGELDSTEQIAAAATTLLEADASRSAIGRFHALWLGYEKLSREGLSAQMHAETQALVERVVFDEREPWTGILTADQTYLTPDLAEHYGLPAPEGSGSWVDYGESGRGGLLSHGAFLSVGSKFGDTSPTQRGLLVRTRLFCQDIPPPPPDLMVDVDEPPPGADPDACKQDNYYMWQEPACAPCHAQMDTIGFGLEQYDAAGAFRDHEPGRPECAISGDGDFSGVGAFNGPVELAQLAVESGFVEACAARQLYRFAIGRTELDAHDEALIERVLESEGGAFELFGFVEAYVASEAFRHRREEGEE